MTEARPEDVEVEVDADDAVVEGTTQICPVCDENHPYLGRHMAQAHPAEWSRFESVRLRVWIPKEGEG
jgi:hypothetical protein